MAARHRHTNDYIQPPPLNRGISDSSSDSSPDSYQYNPHTQNYPPLHNGVNPSYTTGFSSTSTTTKVGDRDIPGREISRTPSPTPSEAEELAKTNVIDWNKLKNWRFWIRREWLWYYVIGGIILTITVLVAVFDKQIVHFLQPTANKIKKLPAGFLIPIAIFFVISFPPLFGHEILAILCGLVYGLWVGFAITAAGTYFGEVGNFYAFKYCCRARGEKLEKTDLRYACLARVVREGGILVALIARYSAIPGHFTTAVFSTCGMNIWVFSVAAILSLPKQFVIVYVGVVLEQEGTGQNDTKNKIIQYVVLAITTVVTYLAMRWILKRMNAAKPAVIYARRKARQAKLSRAQFVPSPTRSSDDASAPFNPTNSESELPLNPGETNYHQRWDSDGHAVGYSGDASTAIRQPSPRYHQTQQSQQQPNRIPTYRTEGGGGYSTTGARYDNGAQHDPAMRERERERVPVGPSIPPGIPQQQRQDSVESVGWDMQNQGMGADAYRLPAIKNATPLSTTFNPPHPYPPTLPSSSSSSPTPYTLAHPQPQTHQISPLATGSSNNPFQAMISGAPQVSSSPVYSNSPVQYASYPSSAANPNDQAYAYGSVSTPTPKPGPAQSEQIRAQSLSVQQQLQQQQTQSLSYVAASPYVGGAVMSPVAGGQEDISLPTPPFQYSSPMATQQQQFLQQQQQSQQSHQQQHPIQSSHVQPSSSTFPQPQPHQHQHQLEPSGASSYYTSADHSRVGTEEPLIPPSRTQMNSSPPPPSYRSAIP